MALSQVVDTWVITRANNRPVIEPALLSAQNPNLHFIYCDLPGWLRFWKKAPGGVLVYYYLWQLMAYWRARKLHRRLSFDLVHHVTFVKYWAPSFLSLLPAPFIWGPVGGGESAPRSFLPALGLRGLVWEWLRDAARSWFALDPFVRMTARRATLGLATTEETRARMKRLGCKETTIYPESGLVRREYEELSRAPRRMGPPFRLLSLGRLIPLKGFEFGLRAFANSALHSTEAEYWFVGEGPERRKLEALSRKLGIAEQVVFWGQLPRSKALERLAECDVLVHPSLHDSGGWVCLEAMASGRPVVCLNLGGPAVQVTEETGIKITAVSPQQVIEDLTAAFTLLASDPQKRLAMGDAGRRRVAGSFIWELKIRRFLEMVSPGCAGRVVRSHATADWEAQSV